MSESPETAVQYGVEYPMFAEDKWGEGIYNNLGAALQALGNPAVTGRTLYRREGPDSPWVEQTGAAE